MWSVDEIIITADIKSALQAWFVGKTVVDFRLVGDGSVGKIIIIWK